MPPLWGGAHPTGEGFVWPEISPRRSTEEAFVFHRETSMMKRPSFQFYPGDWLSDPALRTCSLGARGLWADMMCMMHSGSPYGYLKVGSKVILPANLARICGITTAEAEAYLEELETSGIFSRNEEGCTRPGEPR
jgi:hypothetical protein